MKASIISVSLLVACLCVSARTASADEAKVDRPEEYIVATVNCIVGAAPLVLNLIFDRDLGREETLATASTAFGRAGLNQEHCAAPQITETDDPAGSVAAADATRAITLVAYSSNVPDARHEEPVFVGDVAYPRPQITIDESGAWVAKTYPDRSLQHPPYTKGYVSPHAFHNCPSAGQTKVSVLDSRYLVQVIQVSCAGDSGPGYQLYFFGLGVFCSENRGDDVRPRIVVEGAAYLALEFEIHRVLQSFLR